MIYEHGRPLADITLFVKELFDAKKEVTRRSIYLILESDHDTDNKIAYWKNKGYIKQVRRGVWTKVID